MDLGNWASGQYSLHGGFWFSDALQPTAAHASITGSINGLEAGSTTGRRVRVELTNLRTGEVRTALVNQFGFYVFDDLEISVLYQVRAEGQAMRFEPESMTVRLVDNVTDVNFTAHPNQ